MMMKESENMNQAMENLLENIKKDYAEWTMRGVLAKGETEYSDINKKMISEFNDGLTIQEGRKYAKIVSSRSVWGFVQMADDNKFKAGDILMAAGWQGPARNAARGNIFEDYDIRWTGPNYL